MPLPRVRPAIPALFAAVLSLAASAAPRADRFFPHEPKVSALPNGLRVVRLAFPSEGLVAFQTVVRVGSRNEVEPGHTGFAHFFEHMMFKGTPTRPEGQREAILSRAGFNDNAYTTDDFTVYHSYGPSTALEQLIELEADRFRNLTYSEPSFQTEAKAVLGEYHKSASRPELKLEEALLGAAFKKHPYGHTTLGFYEDIQQMPSRYEYSKQFFARWYTPDNTVLVVVGDFDDAKLISLVHRHYGPWNGRSAQVVIPSEPPQAERRTTRVPWNGPTLPRQMIAWRTPRARLDTLDAAIQEVLAAYLVGPTSDLHNRQRVEDIKSNIRYAFLMGLESADQIASQLAWFIGIFGDADGVERHLQNIRTVTPERLVTFARAHLTARNRTEVTLTPTPAPAAASKGSNR
jgi:zinc protease